MSQAVRGGTAQPNLRQRVQQPLKKQSCVGLISDLLKLPNAELCIFFDGDTIRASAFACTWRQAISQVPDLELWLTLMRRLSVLGALHPSPQLCSAVEKLQKHVDIANLAGKVLNDLNR